MKFIDKLIHDESGNRIRAIRDFLFINVGIFMVAIGINVFKNPNQFAFGGVSGISLILRYYFPSISFGGIMMGLNLFLILVGFLFLGKNFATKSLYGSFALSFMVWLIEIVYPISQPLTNQAFMELIYAVFLPGIGGAIVFHYGATTGGTDIIAKILSKYFHLKVSICLLISDFSIAFFAGYVFGPTSLLYSILGVCLKSFVMDIFLESLKIYKIVVIISCKTDDIKNYICKELNRGATIHKATGAYTIKEKEVITTVLNRRQAIKLQLFCNNIDPNAFITLSNSSQILGNGFQRFE